MSKSCCMFAGQGAQVPGMGRDFAEADAEAMGFFEKANAVLGFDLMKVCFEGPAEELSARRRSSPSPPAFRSANGGRSARRVRSTSRRR